MGNFDLEELELAIAVENARLHNAKTRVASLENDVEIIEHTICCFGEEKSTSSNQ